eukprot:2689928-Pleurochrysis_carterae.AAC.1
MTTLVIKLSQGDERTTERTSTFQHGRASEREGARTKQGESEVNRQRVGEGEEGWRGRRGLERERGRDRLGGRESEYEKQQETKGRESDGRDSESNKATSCHRFNHSACSTHIVQGQLPDSATGRGRTVGQRQAASRQSRFVNQRGRAL